MVPTPHPFHRNRSLVKKSSALPLMQDIALTSSNRPHTHTSLSVDHKEVESLRRTTLNVAKVVQLPNEKESSLLDEPPCDLRRGEGSGEEKNPAGFKEKGGDTPHTSPPTRSAQWVFLKR